MIQEQYCTLETCQLLKKAGFPQDPQMAALISDFADAPTQAQAMRWLREEHGIVVQITYAEFYDPYEWYYILLNLADGKSLYCKFECFPTYDYALAAGIQAACKYLIDKGGEG